MPKTADKPATAGTRDACNNTHKNLRKYGESLTPNLTDTGLGDSTTHPWGESSTHRLTVQYQRGKLTTLRLTDEGEFSFKYSKADSRNYQNEYLREIEAKIKTAKKFLKGTYAEPTYAKTSENTVRYHVFKHIHINPLLHPFLCKMWFQIRCTD